MIPPSFLVVPLNGDGSFNYQPDLNFNGSDGFTYHGTDGTESSAVAE